MLCPQFTEVEWGIAPQLAEWAEVATFDAPGVGDEPVPEGGFEAYDRQLIVDRALRELDELGWDSYFVVGDAWGTATAARVAVARPEPVLGVALGHAAPDYGTDGERPAINGEVAAAFTTLMHSDYDSFVRYGLTQFTQGGFDEDVATQMVDRFPEMDVAARVWETLMGDRESVADLLRQLDVPLLLGMHRGCLVFTPEGFEDLTAAFPDAHTAEVDKATSASEEFAAALRDFCERVAG
jgi:pimeloyl-ACP methyl ester carboxylesterase